MCKFHYNTEVSKVACGMGFGRDRELEGEYSSFLLQYSPHYSEYASLFDAMTAQTDQHFHSHIFQVYMHPPVRVGQFVARQILVVVVQRNVAGKSQCSLAASASEGAIRKLERRIGALNLGQSCRQVAKKAEQEGFRMLGAVVVHRDPSEEALIVVQLSGKEIV